MIIDYIKLLRVPNLIFIAAIQLLMHYCIVVPVLSQYGVTPSMNLFHLLLLVVATVFIAAGGYIINDYFDMRIDEINKPYTRIVGKNLTRRQTIVFYQIISAIGVISGLVLCYYAKSLTYCFIFLMILGLLWFYSSSYKRQFIVGNFVVSILAAMVPFILVLFENRFFLLEYGLSEESLYLNRLLMYWIGGFSFFAFIWTYIREIIKDMEDEEGDREMECHTFPIVLGIQKTKTILYVLISIALMFCGYLIFKVIPLSSSLSWRYFLSGIVVPAIILLYLIFRSNSKADYRMNEHIVKIIMIIGTLYSLLVWYLM